VEDFNSGTMPLAGVGISETFIDWFEATNYPVIDLYDPVMVASLRLRELLE